MVDVEGIEVTGPLLVASVAIGALGAGIFLDLLVLPKAEPAAAQALGEPWGKGR